MRSAGKSKKKTKAFELKAWRLVLKVSALDKHLFIILWHKYQVDISIEVISMSIKI